MTDLLAARLTMAISLGFHIVLAAIGMVMPFLMAAAHRRWLRTGDEDAYRLTRMWMQGVAIFFATGAVSGTALSFELGILWPTFMKHAGPIFGMPFSLEGAAFFIEAIALGIYMYGWQRIPARLHWWVGLVVGFAGLSSGLLVISANGWMNSPSGFRWQDGQAFDVDPWAAMFNPAWATQSTHMMVASFEAVGFAVAGVHTLLLSRLERGPNVNVHQRQLHTLALRIALIFGGVAALLQPIHGHWTAQDVAKRQPLKLAAMEAHFHTGPRAPLLIGGLPDEDTQSVSWGLEVPGGLSVLAFDDPDAVVAGLDSAPRDEWPPVRIVHAAFQVMVGIGSWLALLALLCFFSMRFRPHWLEQPLLRRALIVSAPLGLLAIEAGWIVTEVGRQPWIIYGIMRTEDAVTPVPGQVWHLLAFSSLYAVIGLSTLWMWRRQVRHAAYVEGPSEALRAWARLSKDRS